MYSFLRSLLFALPPEKAHELSLSILNYIPGCFFTKSEPRPLKAMGIEFPNLIGLAAGLDKNAEYLAALSKLGFGFIEVGTVTPKPQEGNTKPRLFRLPQARAIINRMGFNNFGVEQLVKNIEAADYSGILGINIGKNKDTVLNRAVEDYIFCLQKVYAHASYITINISSPNTPDLRLLQQHQYFADLIQQLKQEQLRLTDRYKCYVPLVVKLSPDETHDSYKYMVESILKNQIDGIIATNTSSDHTSVKHLSKGLEQGGLSGQPIAERTTHCLRILKQMVGNQVTLIGVGGIDHGHVAQQKLQAGATLLQIYTGLIYQGPKLIKTIMDYTRF